MSSAPKQAPDLNKPQRDAVERTGQDVCVIAGPGSGKTRVLVERFAWLVERGVEPEKILAITFTEKAANEIRARLAKRFSHDPSMRQRLERAQISTIHGFCHALLRQHALRAGLDPRFEVLDDVEAAAHRRAAMQAALDEVAREKPEQFLHLASVWPADDMAQPLLAVHETIRVSGNLQDALKPPTLPEPETLLAAFRTELDAAIQAASSARQTDAARARRDALVSLQADLDTIPAHQLPERVKAVKLTGAGDAVKAPVTHMRQLAGQYLQAWAAREFASQRELLCEIMKRFHQLYAALRKELAAVDFLDLEEITLQMLTGDEEIRQQVQQSYEHVLMDELQDTNPIQWKILALVRRPGRFFAVGDINQSIYGFRHAEPRLFEAYEESVRQSGAIVDRLTENYRTRSEILEAVSRILVEPHWDNKGIRHHELKASATFARGESPYVEILCTDRASGDEANVHLWLAARLRELYGRPLSGEDRTARFSDMAIFVRNSNSFAAIEDALERFSIPYVISGGKTFFESGEVIDFLNLLRVIAFPEDEIAAFALLRSPFFGVSDEDVFRRRIARTLWLPQEQARMEALRALCRSMPVSAVLARFADESGYMKRLDALGAANCTKFFDLLDRLEARAGRDPGLLVDEVERLRDLAAEANAPVLEAGDAVQVMTIHKAKGLEFPIVAVADLQKGEFSRQDPVQYDSANGLGFRWRLPSGQSVCDPRYEAIVAARKTRESAERDRLLYVALTRARERLILSFTNPARGGQSAWHKKVLNGLGLQIPGDPGVALDNGLVRITRVAGEPQIPAAPTVVRAAPPAEITRLAEEPEPPSSVSVTQLALFARCPRRYLLSARLNWPVAPGGEGGALELGTEVHHYLAEIRRDVSAEARQLAEVFENSDLARRARRAPVCRREMDFLVECDGTLLHGQIDLWFDPGNGPVIVDYKTDQHLNESRQESYEFQLRLYALALEILTGKRAAEAWLFALRQGEAHPVELSSAAFEEAKAILAEWREACRRGEFPPREQPECRWCPFSGGACPVTVR
ncbi:MAG: UvrD-helicase domain-containing protein [Bryobacteraceae bacterium]